MSDDKKCGGKCEECIICKGKKLCCHCSHSGYHACVTWDRVKTVDKKDTVTKSGKFTASPYAKDGRKNG